MGRVRLAPTATSACPPPAPLATAPDGFPDQHEASINDHAVAAATLRFIDERRGALLLHAGMVGRGALGVVVHGPSGVGKSTLTLALTARGTSYVSDETVCLDPHTLHVTLFRKPLTVKRASQEMLADYRPPTDRIDPTSGSWHIDPDTLHSNGSPASTDTSLRPALLVFPDVQPDHAGVGVHPLSPARAAFLLGEQSSALWAVEPRPLAALERLVRTAPAYRLTYGNAFEAADVIIDDLLGTLPTTAAAAALGVSDEPQATPTTTSHPARADGVDWIELDGEAVLFDGQQLHHLDAPGAAVWQRLDGTRSLTDIAAELAADFSADPNRVALDVEDLVRVMTSSGVVRLPEE